jgi:hypothetical protein
MSNKPAGMRKIMVGTPMYDGKLEADFMVSFFHTMELAVLNDIQLTLKTIIGCSLIQKARDELFRIAYESEVDDLIFIDSDQAWTQKDFGNLISPTVDVIGGAVISKNDLVHYNVKTFEKKYDFYYGLIDARAVGTGFLRFSKRAIKMLWDASEEYKDGDKTYRHVFETKVVNGQLLGEDVMVCQKWRDLGEKVYVHPDISISHIGKKRWDGGSFKDYVRIANANWEAENDKSA